MLPQGPTGNKYKAKYVWYDGSSEYHKLPLSTADRSSVCTAWSCIFSAL